MDIPLNAAYSVLPKANVTDSRNEIKDDGNFIIWSESKGEGSRRVSVVSVLLLMDLQLRVECMGSNKKRMILKEINQC